MGIRFFLNSFFSSDNIRIRDIPGKCISKHFLWTDQFRPLGQSVEVDRQCDFGNARRNLSPSLWVNFPNDLCKNGDVPRLKEASNFIIIFLYRPKESKSIGRFLFCRYSDTVFCSPISSSKGANCRSHCIISTGNYANNLLRLIYLTVLSFEVYFCFSILESDGKKQLMLLGYKLYQNITL